MSTKLSKRERELVDRARAAFRGGGLLDDIAWPRAVEHKFFADGASRLPEPVYRIDRDAAKARLDALDAFERELTGDGALERLLRMRLESHRLGSRLLLGAGTKAFGALSVEAYGGARTTWLDGDTTNLDFANHLTERIGEPRAEPHEHAGKLDADGLAAFVGERLAGHHAPHVEIVVDDELGAKAIAGKTRLRIRRDATFEREEARSLFLHEVETHVFTAQNGDAQPHLDFLDSGGPLATRTQEGLAVFSELYAQAITLSRLRRLVERVKLVAMAEDGASFLDLYRHLVGKGIDPHAAYLDSMRICRGGLVEGGAPFTKDAVYLAGLVEVYDFLRLSVSSEDRLLPEVLVSGRLSLAEMEPLVALAEDGILEPPRYKPAWLRRWDDLVVHFAFSSFLTEIDLHFVASRHPWIARRAAAGARRNGDASSPA